VQQHWEVEQHQLQLSLQLVFERVDWLEQILSFEISQVVNDWFAENLGLELGLSGIL